MGRLEIKNLEAKLSNFQAKINEKNIRERREYEEILEMQRNPALAAARQKRKYDLNLEPEWWRPRFIYPYALDPTPFKEGTVSPHPGNICSLDGYNFDINLLYSGLNGGPKLPSQKLNVVDT